MDTSPGGKPVLWNVDPHTHERLPNIVMSRYCAVTPHTVEFVKKLIIATEHLQNNLEANPSPDAGSIPTRDLPDHIVQLVEVLIANEAAMRFIENVVIPGAVGHQNEYIREEIARLLKDSDMWDIKDARTSHIKDGSPHVIDEARGPDSPFFHVDSKTPTGELRIGFSPHISTRLRVGWHAIEPEGIGNATPLQDVSGQSVSSVEQPDPGTIILWEAGSGVHDIPEIRKSDLDEIGGTRDFGTLSFTFERACHQAIDTVTAKLMDPPALLASEPPDLEF